MNYIGFAFNFNIQRCEVSVGEEWKIIKYGYRPLFESLLRHGMKADLFITGFSTQSISDIDPDLIDLIRSNLVRDCETSPLAAHTASEQLFALGTYTYTHPIMQLLTQRELAAQIETGISIDRAFYGVEPRGFFPPEFAFTYDMSSELAKAGIEWTIVLSDFAHNRYPELKRGGVFLPYFAVQPDGSSIGAIPIALDLEGPGRRFFKRMLQGSLSVDDTIQGIKAFLESHDEVFIVIERDAETLYIDDLDSGIPATQKRLEAFFEALKRMASQLPGTRFVTIEEYLAEKGYSQRLSIPEYLGNTRIETFTEGISKPAWDLTCSVRDRLFLLEAQYSSIKKASGPLKKAWEHLLLSHNSDGRIGYWHSDWLPGEHTAVESRRDFVLQNLILAGQYLDIIEEING